MQYLQDVHAFHKRFNIPQPTNCAEDLDEKAMQFRLLFIYEELEELKVAIAMDNKADALDALVDLVYVTLGMSLMMGLDFQEAWTRVQAANMKKIPGMHSRRHDTLDVVKPEGWVPPDHSDLVLPTHERSFP